MIPALKRRLVADAAGRFRAAGRFAHYFARGKLGADPIFPALLEPGLIPVGARLLDLGCGQGLVAAWLEAANRIDAAGEWPAALPSPPRVAQYHGIERMPAEVRRARLALEPDMAITEGDLLTLPWPAADLILLLDVLHYLPPERQFAVLQRVRQHLPADGRLLLRVGDAGASLRHGWSQMLDRAVSRLRGYGDGKLHGRGLEEWAALLSRCDFAFERMPMGGGTGLPNWLFVARPGSGNLA
jgi:SAM-dependent methyltransferase